MGKWNRILRVVVLVAGAALGACLVLLFAAYMYLQTEAGRADLARILAGLLSRPGQAEITITRLSGDLPGQIHLSGIEVRDMEGEWLSLRSVAVEWRPVALISGRLHVTRADVSGLRVARLPVESKEHEEPRELQWPLLPFTVAVDRFSFDDVFLDAPVLGVTASFRAVGETMTTDDRIVKTMVTVERTDGIPAYAEASVLYHPRTESLTLRLEVDEPQGGVIARILQLSGLPPVSIRLNGDGPLAAWRGRLMAQAGDLALIEMDINVDRDRAYTVQAHGRADVTRSVDEPLRGLLSPAVSFTLELGFSDAESIALRQGRLTSDALRLDLEGQFERGQLELEAALMPTPQGIGVLNDLWAPATADHVGMSGRLSGPVLQPEVRLEIALTKVSLSDVSARAFRGSFLLHADRPLGTPGLKTLIEGLGQIEGLYLVAPKMQALPRETVDWAFDGQIDSDRKTLDLAKISLSTDRAQVAGSGSINLSKQSGYASIHVQLGDLTTLAPATGVPLHGSAMIEAHVQSGDFAQGLDAQITGELRDLSVEQSTLDALLGRRVAVAARVATAADSRLRLDDVKITGEVIELDGALILAPGLQEVDGHYDIRIKKLAALAKSFGEPIHGGLTITGALHGHPADPALHGSFFLTDGRFRDIALGALEGTFTLARVTTEPRGSLSLTVQNPPFGPAHASTGFVLARESSLQLSEVSVTTRQTEAVGDFVINLSGGPLEGTLSGRATSLTSWSDIAQRPLAGAASFEIHLRPDGPRQAADVRLEGSQVTIGFPPGEAVELGRVKASARLEDAGRAPRGHFAVEAQDARWGEARLSSVSLAADASNLGSASLRAEGTGDLHGPFTFDLTGTVARKIQDLHLTLDRLQANMAGTALLLQQPLEITYAPEGFHTNDLVLDVADGRIVAQGRINTGEISTMLELMRFPLSLTQIVWPHAGLSGTMTGHARIAGPVENPTGQLDIALADVRSAEWGSELPSLSGVLRGDWSNGRLKVDAEMGNLPDTSLVLEAGVPLRLSAPPLAVHIPVEEPVSGHLTWRGDLAGVWTLLALGEDRVRGRAELVMDWSGTVGAPRVSGHLALTDGEYENFNSGTIVRNIELTGHGSERQVVITRAIGTDGDSGRFSASGTLDLVPTQDFPMDLSMELQKAVVIRHDVLTATATGRIALQGPASNPLLSGQVKTDRVEARIASLPREVVKLDVIEVNTAGPVPHGTLQANGTEEPSMQLDLSVTMPNQVFIRGRGLDSEWAGDLRITGTVRAPMIEGMLRPVRGLFAFAGKDFILGDGSIRFDGTEEIDPLLNLSATYSRADFTATVDIRGSALHPSITLSSQPPLPESEIVSRVLFDRGVGQLSAIEAAQLADAIASLTGEGAPNILDVARRTLGVDVFRVEASPDDTEAPVLTVGKYLSEDVYVGFAQGTDPATGSTSVEVQIMPNVTVKTDVRQDGVSNVGIKWRWDY